MENETTPEKATVEPRHELACNQRFLALKNAFVIIDAFANPSVDPETMENYEKLKKQLTERYEEGTTIDGIETLSF